MKNKKVVALLSGLGVCFAVNAMEVDTAKEEDKLTKVKKSLNSLREMVSDNQVPIFDVIFNYKWKVITEVKVENDNLYILKKELPDDMVRLISQDRFVKILGGNEDYLKISDTLVSDLDLNNLKLLIQLDVNFINSQQNLKNDDKTPTSTPIDAFIGDYQVGYNDASRLKYFNLDGTYFGKNNIEITGGFGNNGIENTRSSFYLKKIFEDNSVLRVGEGTSNQHTSFNNANLLGFKYSTAYFNEQNSDISMFAPVLPIQGYSINPSSMDLFINDRLYQTYDLGVGNYALNLPLTTSLGTGIFKTVIRDKMGNPQIIEIPFFTHKELIKKGHWEYEYGVGALQNNNNSYSRKYSGKEYAADAIFKYGLTDNISASLFLQNSRYYSMGEAKVDFTAKYIPGLVTLGYAQNNNKQNWATLGFQSKKANTSLNYALNYSYSPSGDFCSNFTTICAEKKINGYVSYSSPSGWGNFNVGFANSKSGNKDLQTLSLSWNKKISKNMHLHTGVYKNKGINSGIVNNSLQANVSLTINWDDKVSSNHNYSKSEGSDASFTNSLYFQEDNRNPIRGFGSIQTTNKNGKNEGAIQYQNNALSFAKYNAYVENADGKTASSHNLSGSFYYIPEKDYYGFTKSSDGGITLIEIENGVKGIAVLQANRYSTKTNNKGIAVVTGTKPNTFNSVSLDIATVPFDRPVDNLQKDFIAPKAGASKIVFKMAIEPFDIKIKGAGSGGLLYINNEYYMVTPNGKSSVGYEGFATYERNDGSICHLEISKDKKEYVCW